MNLGLVLHRITHDIGYRQEMANWIRDLSIAKKIWLLTGFVLLLTMAGGLTVLISKRQAMEAEKKLATKHVVETASGVAAYYEKQAQAGKMTDDEARTRALETIGSLRYEEKEYLWINDMQPRMVMHPMRPDLNGKELADYKDPNGKRLFVAFVDAVKQGGGAGYVEYMWPKPGSDKPVAKVSYVQAFTPWGWVIGSGIYIDDVEAAFWADLFRLAAWGLLILGIVALVIHFAVKEINRRLKQAVDVANAIAANDLTARVDDSSRDEIGQLLVSLRTMQVNLADTVSQIQAISEVVSTASVEIASGNADLSSRTESQASSLEETASSMEEMTGTVKQNAENARQANQLVASTAEIAAKGGTVVSEVVETMSSIKESSKKIADIIGVIDGIAFQTNILALNAAVEAARAGEQGRGFAVVASEVRSLAQRSAGAAKEIKALIEDSVGKVETGGRLVDEAGKTMDEIVTSVKRVTDIMSEIAAASHEQSAGIEQVNQAVGQMDEMTQQNAALVEEAAAAAESLREQAGKLAEAVSVFRVAGRRSPAAVRHIEPAASRVLAVVPARKAGLVPPVSGRYPKKLAVAGGDWETF